MYSDPYISITKNISLVQALLGGVVEVETVYGMKKIVLPASTNYNDVFTIEGQQNEVEHQVTIKIDMPKELSAKQMKGLYDYQQIETPILKNL